MSATSAVPTFLAPMGKRMHYGYFLLSEADRRFYMGTTSDLRKRVSLHATGRVRSTSYRRPLKLIYYEYRSNFACSLSELRGNELERHEACLRLEDAYRRERFLKSGKGDRYLRNRLARSLSQLNEN